MFDKRKMPGMRNFRYKTGNKYYFPTKDIEYESLVIRYCSFVKGKEMCVNFPQCIVRKFNR